MLEELGKREYPPEPSPAEDPGRPDMMKDVFCHGQNVELSRSWPARCRMA